MDEVPKIVSIDANALICLCERDGDRQEKIRHLLLRVDKVKGKVVIPTPAIAEFLVGADRAGLSILDELQRRSSVCIGDFDLAAAFEASQMDAAAKGRGDKRDGASECWQKIKIDRQIVAIAKAKGAKLVISDDDGVRSAAARVGIHALSVDDLPIPDHARQAKLSIPDPKPEK